MILWKKVVKFRYIEREDMAMITISNITIIIILYYTLPYYIIRQYIYFINI